MSNRRLPSRSLLALVKADGFVRHVSLDAQKWILNRCAPAPKGRSVEIENFPELRGPEDAPAALAAIATSVADGALSIAEGALAAEIVSKFLEVVERARRLARGA